MPLKWTVYLHRSFHPPGKHGKTAPNEVALTASLHPVDLAEVTSQSDEIILLPGKYIVTVHTNGWVGIFQSTLTQLTLQMSTSDARW